MKLRMKKVFRKQRNSVATMTDGQADLCSKIR